MSFESRWVEAPAHVTEAEPGLPEGFRAAGVACGLKPSGGLDLGLLVSDAPDTASAARFTRSGVLAAPVLLTQERCRLDAIRVGRRQRRQRQRGHGPARGRGRRAHAGRRLDGEPACREDQVAVASTGVIGVPLDVDKIIKGIARRARRPRALRRRHVRRGDPHDRQVRQVGVAGGRAARPAPCG